MVLSLTNKGRREQLVFSSNPKVYAIQLLHTKRKMQGKRDALLRPSEAPTAETHGMIKGAHIDTVSSTQFAHPGHRKPATDRDLWFFCRRKDKSRLDYFQDSFSRAREGRYLLDIAYR